MKFIDDDSNVICEIVNLDNFEIGIIPNNKVSSDGIKVKLHNNLSLIPKNEINMFSYPMVIITDRGLILGDDVYLFRHKTNIDDKYIPVFHINDIIHYEIDLPDDFQIISFLLNHFGLKYLLNDHLLVSNKDRNIDFNEIEYLFLNHPTLLKQILLSNLYKHTNGRFKNYLDQELDLTTLTKFNDIIYISEDNIFDKEIKDKDYIIPKSKYTFTDIINILKEVDFQKQIYNENILNRLTTNMKRLDKVLSKCIDENLELKRNHIYDMEKYVKYYKKILMDKL